MPAARSLQRQIRPRGPATDAEALVGDAGIVVELRGEKGRAAPACCAQIRRAGLTRGLGWDRAERTIHGAQSLRLARDGLRELGVALRAKGEQVGLRSTHGKHEMA